MSGAVSLLAVFALGLVSGFLLRGAARLSMSADEVAWGWGYGSRRRRWGRRARRGDAARLAAPARMAQDEKDRAVDARRRSRLPFLAGLTTGAMFAAGYLLLDSHSEMLAWITLSLTETMPAVMRLALWLG